MFTEAGFGVWQTSWDLQTLIFFPTLHFFSLCVSVIASSGIETGLIPNSFPTVMRDSPPPPFFCTVIVYICVILKKAVAGGDEKPSKKCLESPAGPWILWQRIRAAIQNCSQAAVAASTPMLRLYFMQTQISCATVKLRVALAVWLLSSSQYSGERRS